MSTTLTRQHGYLLLLSTALYCLYGQRCDAAPAVAEAEKNVVLRSCLDFAKFLCLDLTQTNHVEISAFRERRVGGPVFQVSTLRFDDYEFWIQKDGTVRRFYVKRPSELRKQESSCARPPSARDVRDLLCPKVRFAAPETTHIEEITRTDLPLRKSAHYTWGKEESRDLIKGPKFYWEWVDVQMDENDQRFLSVQNTVKTAR